MDDQEDASKQEGGIAKLDVDKDVTLEDVDAEVAVDADDTDEAKPAEVEEVIEVVTTAKLMIERKGIVIQDPEEIATASDQVKIKEKQDNTVMRYQALKRKLVTEAQARKKMMGRLPDSEAKVYHLDLQHAEKVLSMQDPDEAEPAEVEKVIEVVTSAKLMTEVVITAVTAAKLMTLRRRKGVVLQDPVERATASVIVHSENDVVDQVKRKEKQDNTVMRYQALKRKPVTEAQVRKNTMRKKMRRSQNKKKEVKEKMIVLSREQLRNTELMKREDLEMLWKLVQEIFQSSEPKNFLDDLKLNIFKTTPLPSPTQEHIPSPPQAHTAQPSSPSPQQLSQTVSISMTLLNTLLKTCATLTKKVANLEQDK
nr:hypothetical protein [Tanacetum cinerariifolium]